MRPAVDSLLEKSSGLPADVLSPLSSRKLATQLANDQIQLGVFAGVEFARERLKHPELRPLAILVNQHCGRQAIVLVRADSQANSLSDMKGGKLALPKHSPDHCRLFLKAHCHALGEEFQMLFSRVTEPPTVEDALDDLVDGLIGTAVVDSAGLKSFARRKPGRFAKLRILVKSERFPDTVIAYHDEALGESVIQRLRQNLSHADQTPEGRNILTFWKSTRFELPTADYERLLTDIVKTHPVSEPENTDVNFRKLLLGAGAMTKKIADGFFVNAAEK